MVPSDTVMKIYISDLPPPRKRPQNFSPSMEDLTHPYTKLGKAQSLKFRHSENELVDDDCDAGRHLACAKLGLVELAYLRKIA